MPVFIDYLTLLLMNMVAGYVLLAAYVVKGMDDPDQKRWAAGFGIVGLVALVFGTHLTLTWPLPGPYNSIYGEMSVLFGVIFGGAAVCLARGWDLTIVAGYAFFGGLGAVILGARILTAKLTVAPIPSGIGFVFSGIAGVFAAPTLIWMRQNKAFRILAALVLLLPAAIWMATVCKEYWGHPAFFKDWVPLATRIPIPPAPPGH